MTLETVSKQLCSQCHKPLYYQVFLGPVCGACCRRNQAKVTGRLLLTKRPVKSR